MRVKWNRNLDGIRPLITVPETDVISNGKLDEEDDIQNKNSFIDLNDNTTVAQTLIHSSENTINSINGRECESPCPSSTSISSKRSDKSRARISGLFGLFRVKDKGNTDNTSEDGMSNISEMSNSTIPSLISHSIAKRKSSYGSRDSININNDRIGFEADTRRRRRANNLLAKSSMRRSWQQLNGTTALPITSGYILTKERIPNHYLNVTNSPRLSVGRRTPENELSIRSRSPIIGAKFGFLPEVNENSTEIESINGNDIKRGDSQCSDNRDSVLENGCNNLVNNSEIVVQTECISSSDLNGNTCCGCDEMDNKVQSVVNSLVSQNLLNDSKLIFDPKNNFKDIKSQPKLISDKTEENSVSKSVVQTNHIRVTTHTNTDLNSELKSAVIPTKFDESIQTEPQFDNLVNNCISEQNESLRPYESRDLNSNDIETPDGPSVPLSIPSINSSKKDNIPVIKVKVTKNQLPESEVVYFSSQIVSSPSTLSAKDINNKCNNDGAVVLTFINDEPMTREVPDKENMKSDVFVKSAPIHGILRVRSKESNGDDNYTNELSKTSESNGKSQKKVHFADNCVHYRNSSRGRSRIVKPRHYSSLGIGVSVNDKKTGNRRLTQANTTGAALTTKRMTNTKIAANNSKRDVRSVQAIDDKQQIQKLTQLCETKTKQLKGLDSEHNYMRLSFDSLAVVIQHLIEQYEPFENPKIKRALKSANKRCEQFKDNLDAKDIELNDMKLIFEEQINHLMKEREKNFSDLNQAKVSHELNIKKLKECHSMEVMKLEDKYKTELVLSHQNYNQLLSDIEVKTSELSEAKELKDSLEIRVKQMEENIMNDKDKKFKYLKEKSKQLELEVESLKVVMDMKNEKIHTLERKMAETQEKINELPIAKETVRGLQQQVETLQITLDRKIHQFNALTREHEDLKGEYEKEMREKRRLSMKNEELVFHLSESFNDSVSGLNNCTNLDPNLFRFKTPIINNDETPIKTNRSINMNTTAGSQSLVSNRKSHSKVNRSVSISNSRSTNSSTFSRGTVFPNNCPTSGSVNTENTFPLDSMNSDEVFESGANFFNSDKKRDKVKRSLGERFAISDETPPQCILDSGFEEIQGLNSLSK